MACAIVHGMDTHTHQTGITNNITIIAPKATWPRIKTAIKKGQELILKDNGSHYTPTNIHTERWKDGKEHVLLFNYGWTPRPPNELTLRKRVLTLTFNGKQFSSVVGGIALLTPKPKTELV